MDHLSEQFGARLVRVIKNVKRRTSSGGTKTVRQSFHVKQANPGDQYAGAKTRNVGALGEKPKQPPSMNLQLQGPGEQPGEATVDAQGNEVNEIPRRLSVRYHEIPWFDKEPEEVEKDPIPRSVRDRFDPKNREAQTSRPLTFDSPVNGVVPTDQVLWGVHEPAYLDKLRVGRIIRLGMAGENSGLLFSKLEAMDGTTLHAYLGLESLVDPHVYLMWGEFYDLEKGNGSIPKRCAAAYEVAKAAGFDDLIPPTVVREDKYGDINPILPADLLERQEEYEEALARRTGEHPDALRNQLSGYGWLQLLREETWTIDGEEWFAEIFQRPGDVEPKSVLNRIFDVMPTDRRFGFIRAAVLDYILWTGDRHLGDIIFSANERHPVHLVWNGLSCPCPCKIGRRFLDQGGEATYVSSDVDLKGGVPMLWSQPLSMMATRGRDKDLDDFEKIGIVVANRMKDDRPFEMARSLLEHDMSPLAIAGVLSRLWLLATHSRKIARNPYVAAQYYASILSGEEPEELQNVAVFVNQSMKKVLIRDFDFVTEMREAEAQGPPEEEEEDKPEEKGPNID